MMRFLIASLDKLTVASLTIQSYQTRGLGRSQATHPTNEQLCYNLTNTFSDKENLRWNLNC